jgi:hypothetical protein
MTTPKERAEIKARELVKGFLNAESRWPKSKQNTDQFINHITDALLEFSQGSTVGDEGDGKELFKDLNHEVPEGFDDLVVLAAKALLTDSPIKRTVRLQKVIRAVYDRSHPPRVVVPESVSDEEIEKLAIDWCDKNTDAYEYFPDKSAWVAGYRAALSKDSAKREGV